MPIYEWECPDGHIITEWAHIDDAPHDRDCTQCDATARRIISRTGIYTDVVLTPADVRRAYGRDTAWDRNLAGAFPAPWRRG